jgi:hypothetical protein
VEVPIFFTPLGAAAVHPIGDLTENPRDISAWWEPWTQLARIGHADIGPQRTPKSLIVREFRDIPSGAVESGQLTKSRSDFDTCVRLPRWKSNFQPIS